MGKDNLEILFKSLENEFDHENPQLGHQQRFLEKLNSDKETEALNLQNKRSFWKPMLGIAASLVLFMFVFTTVQSGTTSYDLANVSPEMAETQDFFAATLEVELEKLRNEMSPEYQDIVVDALFQIELLGQEYEQLKLELKESGDDKRIINAMISNFQNRIELLQNVLEQIDNVKQNSEQNENSSTL